MNEDDVIGQLETELKRLDASDAFVELDEEFEPDAGKLVHLRIGGGYWHFLPGTLLPLLQNLPDKAGSEALNERNASMVWHGPSPKGSRDTSP
ncbi:MAG: hypothetical protein R3E01_02310 [Pirellulaceae bacterium]